MNWYLTIEVHKATKVYFYFFWWVLQVTWTWLFFIPYPVRVCHNVVLLFLVTASSCLHDYQFLAMLFVGICVHKTWYKSASFSLLCAWYKALFLNCCDKKFFVYIMIIQYDHKYPCLYTHGRFANIF